MSMGMRIRLANYLLQRARRTAEATGAEPVIELDEHEINISFERPDREKRAWDPDHYVAGQIYYDGYANPIKPTIDGTPEIDAMDEVETDGGTLEEEDGEDEVHVKMLSSWRYKDYMDQHLITELVRPEEQWSMIIYIMIALSILVFITLVIAAYGAFV